MAKKRKKKKKKKSVAGRIIKYFVLFVLACIAIAGCLCLGLFWGAVKSAPDSDDVSVVSASYPTSVYDSEGAEIIQLSSQGARSTEAEVGEIPDTLAYAFIDLEDERFYEHNGIDIKGIMRAVYVNLTSGKSEGASTITQQLIKNTVFETGGYERSMGSTVKRKFQEWVLAIEIEQLYSKEEILTNYLNTINLGSGNYGVIEAAKYYFGKELDELTISECAVIAAITQNPSAYNPSRYPENNWARAQICLANMLENGHITQEEYDEAIADNPTDRIIAVANETAGTSIYSYFVDALVEQVIEDLQTEAGYTYAQAYNAVYAGGLSIYSTQVTELQEIVDEEINDEENYSGYETTYSISWDMTVQHSDGTYSYYSQSNIRTYYQSLLDSGTYYLDYESTEAADEAIETYKNTVLEDGDEITYEQTYYTLQPQASFVLMDYTTGHVLAISGGRGEKETSLSLNRATGTLRQPGSTFKVVAAFAPALDTGVATLATTYDDAPLTYSTITESTLSVNEAEYDSDTEDEEDEDEEVDEDTDTISNWWGSSYRGLCSVRDAIRDSMNIIACKAMLSVGASTAIDYLESFGYTSITDEDANISTALGGVTYGVTNLENCAAFAAIANSGVYMEPVYYTTVLDREGNVILDTEATQDVHRVIETETASLLTSAMEDVVTDGTGELCALEDGTPLAGKTGTTSSNKDLWFVGYIPNGLCASIWVGYDENIELTSDTTFHKYMYSAIMSRIVEAYDVSGGEFEMEGDIVEATVCDKSGLLSNGLCSSDPAGSQLVTEYFAADNVPEEECEVHQKVKICSDTGLLATSSCTNTYTKVVRVRPNDVDGTEAKGTTPDSSYAAPTKYCSGHSSDEEDEEEDDEDGEDDGSDESVTDDEDTDSGGETSDSEDADAASSGDTSSDTSSDDSSSDSSDEDTDSGGEEDAEDEDSG